MVDVKYINLMKKKRMMSNISFKPDTVYDAHSLECSGLTPYVDKASFDGAVEALKKHNCSLTGTCLQCSTLKDLGIK